MYSSSLFDYALLSKNKFLLNPIAKQEESYSRTVSMVIFMFSIYFSCDFVPFLALTFNLQGEALMQLKWAGVS